MTNLTDEQYKQKMQRRQQIQAEKIDKSIDKKGLIIVNTTWGGTGLQVFEEMATRGLKISFKVTDQFKYFWPIKPQE